MHVLPLLTWLLGLVTPFLWEQLPTTGTTALLCGLALLLLWLGWQRLAVFLVGLCYSCLWGSLTPAPPLLAQDHSIEARVLAAESALYVAIEELDDKALAPVKARLGWYAEEERPEPGQRFRAQVRLKPLYHRLNPGSRAQARRDAAMGIAWTGYVRRLDSVEGQASWQRRWHQYLGERLADFRHQGLMLALLTGDRRAISEPQRALLQGSGTAHLLAISGLHVALVAGLGLWLGHLLPGNGRRLGWLLGLAMAGLYAWQSGLAPPTLRALVALSAWVLWLGWRQPVMAGRLWLGLLALFGTLDPLVLLDSRLWLSFSAVGLILLALWRFPSRGWRALLVLQLGLGFLLWPLQWWLFGTVPAFGLLANLVAVPLVSLVVMPLLLLGLVLPLAWQLADGALGALLWGLAFTNGSLPGPWLLWLLLLPVAALPLRRLARAMLALALAGALLLRPTAQGVWFLDVGQGSATALIKGRQMLLVDTGPGPWALDGARYLAASRTLALMVLSHSDLDHSGGASAFKVPVLAGQSGPGQEPCIGGQALHWGAEPVALLWPPAGFKGEDNDHSCVLFTHIAGHSLLLPGDISRRSEGRRPWPRAQWLAVPHHGSLSSSSPDFIHQVQPELAVFSTGKGNAFGFPKAPVLARYRASGAQTWVIGEQGALFCSVEGCQGLKRFWWEGQAVGVGQR